jgi:hypothetical protein
LKRIERNSEYVVGTQQDWPVSVKIQKNIWFKRFVYNFVTSFSVIFTENGSQHEEFF